MARPVDIIGAMPKRPGAANDEPGPVFRMGSGRGVELLQVRQQPGSGPSARDRTGARAVPQVPGAGTGPASDSETGWCRGAGAAAAMHRGAGVPVVPIAGLRRLLGLAQLDGPAATVTLVVHLQATAQGFVIDAVCDLVAPLPPSLGGPAGRRTFRRTTTRPASR